MTSSDRANRYGGISKHLLTFLAAHQGARQPALVLRDFCKQKRLSRMDAETALSVLLNSGEVVVNRHMELEVHSEGHAVAAE